MTPIIERHLFGPGPTNPYPEATEGLARPLLGHLDPAFLAVMDETCDRLREVWGTRNARTLPLFGQRVRRDGGGVRQHRAPRRCRRGGGERAVRPAHVRGRGAMRRRGRARGAPLGPPVDPERVLAAHPAPAIVAAVHAETSTGVGSEIAALGEAVHAAGDALLLVDAVTSIGGIELRADDWGIDVAYAGTQKCLGVAPGLAPFTINDRAFSRRVERPQSWYLDLGLLGGYVGEAGARAAEAATRRGPCDANAD